MGGGAGIDKLLPFMAVAVNSCQSGTQSGVEMVGIGSKNGIPYSAMLSHVCIPHVAKCKLLLTV